MTGGANLHRWLVEVSGLGARTFHWAYDAGWRPVARATAPVISVGALTVGGAGKTPFCALLARRLSDAGRRVAVVSRGYGRGAERVVVVSRGAGPIVDVRQAGDEPSLLARRTGAIVVVGADRVAAAETAVRLGADAIVLDDAFQHRRLHRDLDVVLVDPSGSPALVLPFGSGREAPSALGRADLVVAVHPYGGRCAANGTDTRRVDAPSREDAGGAGGAQVIRASGGGAEGVLNERDAARVHVAVVPQPWCTLEGRETAPPKRVVLVSAIARPERFARLVAEMGIEVTAHLRFRDHRWLTPGDINRAGHWVRQTGADGVATTEKDAVRWPQGTLRPWVLPVRLDVIHGADRLDAAWTEALRHAEVGE